MKRIAILVLVLAGCVTDLSTTEQDLDPSNDQGGGEPHDAKVTHVRGNAGHASGGSPNLINHGGPVMHSTIVQPIFWGTSWRASDEKVTGINDFYQGVGGTAYAGTNGEYFDSNGNVGTGVTALTPVVDNSAAAKSGSRTAPILAEVCKMITNPQANGYYPVYIDNPRGHAGYCAWHSAGTCGGVTVKFGFFFKLDGDSGCDPQDARTVHSQGLEAIANVSGHELSEMLTDPELDAWYDSSGAENSDKCAWTFGHDYLTFKNGSTWKVQGNWSNAAYNGGTGYDGGGCIDN
jgi:hypothetical protein